MLQQQLAVLQQNNLTLSTEVGTARAHHAETQAQLVWILCVCHYVTLCVSLEVSMIICIFAHNNFARKECQCRDIATSNLRTIDIFSYNGEGYNRAFQVSAAPYLLYVLVGIYCKLLQSLQLCM